MAEKKEVHIRNGGDGGLGMIAGIVAVVLIGFLLLFFAGVFTPEKRGVNVTVDVPKVDAPVKTE
jgi:hypothetical protein